MAASFGLAVGKLVAVIRAGHHALWQPGRAVPLVPNYYASSALTSRQSSPCGGKPFRASTKSKATPVIFHSVAAPTYAQASVLDLYDPDRAMGSFRKDDNKDGPVTWSSVGTESLINEVAQWGKEGKLAILADKSFSSARSKLVAQLKSLDIHWFEHEAIDLRRAETLLAQGVGLESGGLRAIPDLAKAHRVLSLDSDFLGP